MLWVNGVKYDVLKDKQEKASIPEIRSTNSFFSCWEDERAQCRLKFIEQVMNIWGGSYTLSYVGRQRSFLSKKVIP